jgi:hypothetical protein
MDIQNIRDDGNDPLRPTIANACDWIEKARLDGGKVLVHCVSSTLTSFFFMLMDSVLESVEVLALS